MWNGSERRKVSIFLFSALLSLNMQMIFHTSANLMLHCNSGTVSYMPDWMKHPMMRLSLTLSDTITASCYCTHQIKPISVESNCHFVTNPITFQMSANHIRYCLRFSAHCTKLPRNDTSGRQEVVGGVMDTKKHQNDKTGSIVAFMQMPMFTTAGTQWDGMKGVDFLLHTAEPSSCCREILGYGGIHIVAVTSARRDRTDDSVVVAVCCGMCAFTRDVTRERERAKEMASPCWRRIFQRLSSPHYIENLAYVCSLFRPPGSPTTTLTGW